MSIAAKILRALIRLYQLGLSPLKAVFFGPGTGCRHIPCCSSYALNAIENRGALIGGFLALRRVCRCHPWGTAGYDPAPPPTAPPRRLSSPF